MTINEAVEKLVNFYDHIISAKAEESAGGKKIVITELVGMGGAGLGVFQVVSNFEALSEEFAGMSDEQKESVKAAFVESFSHDNKKTELQAERTFAYLIESLDYYADMKKIAAEN